MTNYGPINASTFDDCLARGFGRVVLFLRDNDSQPFRGSILHACGHDLAFDKQCERTREVYLYDVIEATGQLEFYASRILEMLKRQDDHFCYSQLYGLAGQLATHGHVGAREAMYEQVRCDMAWGYSTGADALVELDGVYGFLFIVGEALRNQGGPRNESFEADLLLDKAYDRDGVEKVRSVIDQAGASDPALRDYLKSIDTEWIEWRRRLHQEPESILSYKMLRTLIDDQERPLRISEWWRFGKRTTAAALERIARDLKDETDTIKCSKMVALFCRREFRGDIAPLLNLSISTDRKLSQEAVRVLGKMPDENIRTFAIELIEAETHKLVGLDLLRTSGRASEYPLFLNLLKSNHSDDDFHEIGGSICEVIEHNPSQEAVPILEQLYERGRCSICRSSTVERMIDCETVPHWVSAEAVFDAEVGTRKMAREWIEGRDSSPSPQS